MVMKLEFLNRFAENTHIWNFIKIRPVGAELFHWQADRQVTKQVELCELAEQECECSC